MTKNPAPRAATPSFLSGEQRINKLLAAAGFGSRRQVDELIIEGRVEINGKPVTQVGVKVNADTEKVTVDGEPLKRHRPVYYAVHKPAGVLCTNRDPEGRPRVIDFVPADARLFPVGRLDASSTGLILLTNDGELAQRLAHPKHCVPKTYFVVVAGQVDREAMKRLQRGIYLAEGIARVDGASIRKVRKGCTEIDITLSEGKNREIRRVLARLGHKVVVLRRVAIGPLKLATMPEGSYRPLDSREVAALYQAVEDIKKKHNQERRERKKRNSGDPISLEEAQAQGTKPSSVKPPKKTPQSIVPYDEESDDWDSADEMDFDDNDDLESLPSISENPYRMADDEDVEEDGDEFSDAILVHDSKGESFSTRKGSVIAFDDDDMDGMGGEEIDGLVEDLDSVEALSRGEAAPAPRRRSSDKRGGDRRPSAYAKRSSSGDRDRPASRSGPRRNGPGARPSRREEGSESAADGRPRRPFRSGSSPGAPRGERSGRPGRPGRPAGTRSTGPRSGAPRGPAGEGGFEGRGEGRPARGASRPRREGRSPYESSSDRSREGYASRSPKKFARGGGGGSRTGGPRAEGAGPRGGEGAPRASGRPYGKRPTGKKFGKRPGGGPKRSSR